MTIHVNNIDDGSVDDFLDSVDFGELLNRFNLVEPIRYTEYAQKDVYHNNILKLATMSEGEQLVRLMNQDFDDSLSIELKLDRNSNYEVAA